MGKTSDILPVLGEPALWPELRDELHAIWRATFLAEGDALRAWFAGEATYETVLEALDREEAAAIALAECSVP